MRWRRRIYAERPPRPKTRSLTAKDRDGVLEKMTGEIGRSPILTAFDVQVKVLRGRFYLDWRWDPADGPEQRVIHGRITPLDDPGKLFLLEVERRKNQWSEIARGTPEKLIKAVAGDTEGTFHGLGSLDKSLRKAVKTGITQRPLRELKPGKFVHAKTDKPCTVQEALHYFFGLPIHVIAKPAGWYSRHRTPRIVEYSKDRRIEHGYW